jgi:hypothetical protein
MKYPERIKIAEDLPYESRLGFVAFGAERCLKEARRHPVAREQLEKLPLLTEGLDMLWKRAEQGVVPDPERVNTIRSHVLSYQSPAEDQENIKFNYDVSLVNAGSTLNKGMRLLQNPDTDARTVASALEGPVQAVGNIYADHRNARNAELEVIDTALSRLKKWGNKPFSRAAFGEIPEWKRGELSKKYAEGRLVGTDVHEE